VTGFLLLFALPLSPATRGEFNGDGRDSQGFFSGFFKKKFQPPQARFFYLQRHAQSAQKPRLQGTLTKKPIVQKRLNSDQNSQKRLHRLNDVIIFLTLLNQEIGTVDQVRPGDQVLLIGQLGLVQAESVSFYRPTQFTF